MNWEEQGGSYYVEVHREQGYRVYFSVYPIRLDSHIGLKFWLWESVVERIDKFSSQRVFSDRSTSSLIPMVYSEFRFAQEAAAEEWKVRQGFYRGVIRSHV